MFKLMGNLLYGRNFDIGNDLQAFWPRHFIPAMLIGSTYHYHFILLAVAWLIYGWSPGCEKAETYAAIISQSLQSIWMEFGVLLRLVDHMSIVLIWSHLLNHTHLISSAQCARERAWFIKFHEKNLEVCLHCTYTHQFLSNIVAWYRPLNSRLFKYQFEWLWLSFKVTVLWEGEKKQKEKALCSFSHKFVGQFK